MNKKFISVIMAATLALSSAAICASAAEVDIQPSKETGKIKFDKGSWDKEHSIAFYIWATKEGEHDMFWVAGQWQEEAKWASKKIVADDCEDPKYCEMEVDIMDGWNTFIIFNDLETSAQTFDCVLTPSAFGDTAHMSDELLENPEDSDKTCIGVYFDNAGDCGSHKVITSTGHVVGTALAPNDNPTWIVANALYKLLGKMDKNGEECCTQEKVDTWVDSFGTNKADVWAKFQEFKGQDGREQYDEKEADVKKLLGIEDETDTTSSETNSDGTSSTESNNSSSSSSTSSTSNGGGTTSKTTTNSTTTTTSTTTSTVGNTDTAATGDVTGTAAFAGVLLAAAATIVVTRKKVEE